MAIWLLSPSIRRFRAPSVKSFYSSASSSASSIISSTSTLEYGHEQFLTFSPKVCELIRLIPTLGISPTTTINVTRLPGGLNYRIISITTTTTPPQKPKPKGKILTKFRPTTTTEEEKAEKEQTNTYILRLPRKEKNNGTRLDREVAVLYYLETHTTIPAPRTIAFDLEGDNGCPVELPYILETHIKGVPLDEVFNQMTFGEKKRLVRKLVDLYVKMDKVRFSRAGVLGPKSGSSAIEVESFDLGTARECRSYAQVTTRDMLLSQFESWRAVCGNCVVSLGEAEVVDGYMQKLSGVVMQMERLGCLGDDANVLFHPELVPRNIFVVSVGSGEAVEWVVSGVVDWEAALSVPRVMANRAPSWLWRWGAEEGYDEGDEESDGDIPVDSQRAELKRLFETEMDAALPVFTRYAYKPCFRMLRRLCRFAVWGVRWKEDVDKVVEFLKEWEKMVADQAGKKVQNY